MEKDRTETADYSFDVPLGWINRTVTVWSAPPEVFAMPPNFVVALDKPKPGEALDVYVDRQLADLTRAAKNFHLELRREIPLAGRPSIEIMFRWETPGATMQQRQIYCTLSGGRAASIASTARASDFAEADKDFRAMLRSFQWND